MPPGRTSTTGFWPSSGTGRFVELADPEAPRRPGRHRHSLLPIVRGTGGPGRLARGGATLHPPAMAGMCEPRIEASDEPEPVKPMVTGLADPVRDLPAGKPAAALDAGPGSGTTLEPQGTGGARMHGDCLLRPLDRTRHSEPMPYVGCMGTPSPRQDSFPAPPRCRVRDLTG